jgi:hypothetical protein
MDIYLESRPQRELPPPGMHRAVCTCVAELGTQVTQFGPKSQLLFMFELLDLVTSSGQPFLLRRTYTSTLDPMGALRPDLEGWAGRNLQADELARLNIASLLGTCCLLGVKHDNRGERVYANITSIMARPPGTPEREQPRTALVAFSLRAEPFAMAEYATLPQWVQQTIAKSPEYQRRRKGPSGPALGATVRQRLGGGGGNGGSSNGGAAAAAPSLNDELDDVINY